MNRTYSQRAHWSCRRDWTLLTMVVVIGVAASSARALPFRVSIFAADGTALSEFTVTLNNMHVDQVRIGPDGNVWVARADNSHGSGTPNPKDVVAVFAMDGTELFSISGGGMRHPLAVTWDGEGNIYIAGEDNFFASEVYKYASDGGFVDSFHTSGWSLIDEYNDIVISDDHLFVSSWHGTGNDDQMTKFTLDGATIDTFSSTGPSYFHRDMARGLLGTIWVRTPKNGSGDDLLREFDLAGNEFTTISTSAAVPDSNMVGLEVGENGNLWLMESGSDTLYELSSSGAVVSSLVLDGLSNWITDFTFGPAGEILVANESVISPPCEGDANGDDVVDPLDTGYVLSRFGCDVGPGNPECNDADQNHDGEVDPLDVGFILSRFGDCP